MISQRNLRWIAEALLRCALLTTVMISLNAQSQVDCRGVIARTVST